MYYPSNSFCETFPLNVQLYPIMYQAQGLEGDWSDIAFGEVNASGVTCIWQRKIMTFGNLKL